MAVWVQSGSEGRVHPRDPVADWDCPAQYHQRIGPQIISPGKDPNSEFEVQCLANALSLSQHREV